MKEELLRFMQSKNPNVLDVIGVTNKMWDDEDGSIGEHYYVEYMITYTDPKIMQISTKKGFCLVNKEAFKLYRLNDSGIIWNIN